MTPERYNLIFSGKVLVGQDPTAVRGRLGAAFGLSDAQLKQLFSGNPVPIKHDVDSQTAAQYRAAFHKAGAVLELQKAAPAQSAGAALSGASGEGGAPDAAPPLTLAPPRTGSLIDCAPEVVPAPIPDLSGFQLAADGEPLPAGAGEAETPSIEPPNLELAAPGETLLENPPERPPLRIDTNDLSLAPARSGSLADCARKPDPHPIPDLSGLSLAEPEDQGKKP